MDKFKLIDLLIKQIMEDYQMGDTTVLDQLLLTVDYEVLYASLSDENQQIAND